MESSLSKVDLLLGAHTEEFGVTPRRFLRHGQILVIDKVLDTLRPRFFSTTFVQCFIPRFIALSETRQRNEKSFCCHDTHGFENGRQTFAGCFHIKATGNPSTSAWSPLTGSSVSAPSPVAYEKVRRSDGRNKPRARSPPQKPPQSANGFYVPPDQKATPRSSLVSSSINSDQGYLSVLRQNVFPLFLAVRIIIVAFCLM